MRKLAQLLLLVALAASSRAVDSNSLDYGYDEYGDEEEGFILGVSTLVNGVRPDEIPALLERLRKVRVAIKSQAFGTLSQAVGRRWRTLGETRQLIDAMKLVLEESLNGLSAVRRKVERILADVDRRRALLAPSSSSSSSSSSSPPLAPTEAFFLTNVRDSVPDVLKFTREQFAAVAAAL